MAQRIQLLGILIVIVFLGCGEASQQVADKALPKAALDMDDENETITSPATPGISQTQYKIVPHEGVGPIKFGMKRAALHEALKEVPSAYPIRRVRKADFFFDGAVHVHYSKDDDSVRFIELVHGSEYSFVFEGLDVSHASGQELVQHIQKFDQPDSRLSKEPHTYFFSKLILVLSEPRFANEAHSGMPDYFDAIGLGNEEYLATAKRRLSEKERSVKE